MATWMMLDRFVYRRDDDGFPDESRAPLRATSSTSLGQVFHVAFLPAEPPAISRLYMRWPGGPTRKDGYGSHIAAAHRDLLLLRLTSKQDLDESPYVHYVQDHFICVACSDPVPHLQLKRLPLCTIPMMVKPLRYYGSDNDDDDDEEQTMQQQQRLFFPNCVGLARAKFPVKYEDEFAVAQLAMISQIADTGMMEAEVCVLRSRASADDYEGTWEVKKIPIQHKSYEYKELYNWSMNLSLAFNSADAVITFNNCICWVNYLIGGILFYEVFEEERPPKISYLRLSTQNRPRSTRYPGFLEANRSVCVTSRGDVLNYITSIRTDGELCGPLQPGRGFHIISDTLRTTENGEMKWDQEVVVTSDELWGRNTCETLPRNGLAFPLVSINDPNIVNFMLSEELSDEGDQKIRKVSVVMIDLVTETVNSVFPYIKGDKDLCGQDADMVKAKTHFINSFLPSEFPNFFNLTRNRRRDEKPYEAQGW